MDHILRVCDPKTGDTVTTFDPTDEVQVEAVRREFKSLIANSYFAYAGEAGSKVMEATRTFDPQQEETILTMPVQGG